MSLRSSTKILDFVGDIGGFYQAVDLCIFLIGNYFSAHFFIQSISNSMYIRKKTPAEIDELLKLKNEQKRTLHEN